PALQQEMQSAECETAANGGLRLVVAVDYGGRWDMAQAARTLARQCLQGELAVDAIDETRLAQHMSLHAHSAPDLFIRTGGEHRLSNFLLWDLAYSELYFSATLWPDFDAGQLRQAADWFASRERRFGCVGTAGTAE